MSRRVRAVNICKIAEEAGVSPATVSRVIHRRVGVGEETRRRVEELLRQYDFTPDFPAMRSRRLAVILPYPNFIDYFRLALDGIYAAARAAGLEVGIVIAGDGAAGGGRGSSLLERIRDQQYAGVIAILAERYREELRSLAETELPVVALDERTDLPQVGYIDNDSFGGAAEAARHLLELGHRKIGFLQRPSPWLNQRQRLDGFSQVLAGYGIPLEPHRVVQLPAEPENRVRGMVGLRNMRRLLEQAPEVTAVMCVDDEVALGALTAIHERGLKIPQHISVIGFDNYPETEVWYPALTTVEHPVARIGALAVERIREGLKHPANWVPPCEVLPTRLVIRNSTGPAGLKAIEL